MSGPLPPFVCSIPPQQDEAICLFDADGTLWVDDVADDFTLWMISKGHISGEEWMRYMLIYKDDAPAGCRFLLSLYKGLSREHLMARVEEFWSLHAQREWVEPVIASINFLVERGYPIWVVTGSPTEFMLPLLKLLPVERVLGMDFEFDDQGLITGRHSGISCAGVGKAEKVNSLLQGRPVRFACGNGSLDGPMMKLAEQAWAVYPNLEFLHYAQDQGWFVLPRPADFKEEAKFLL